MAASIFTSKSAYSVLMAAATVSSTVPMMPKARV
jgi:hypothetical protein